MKIGYYCVVVFFMTLGGVLILIPDFSRFIFTKEILDVVCGNV